MDHISVFKSFKSCSTEAVLEDNFLLFADGTNGQIWQMSLEDSQLHLILNDPDESPIGVDYDPITKMVYWTDVTDTRINRIHLDGSGREVVLQLTPGNDANFLILVKLIMRPQRHYAFRLSTRVSGCTSVHLSESR